MESVLLVVHLIVAIAIIVLVLIQPAENDGFMGSSNSNAMMPRRSGDALTRATTMLAGVFFVTSLFLAIAASHRPAAQSILDGGVNANAAKKPSIVIKTEAVKTDAKDAATAVKKEVTDKAADVKEKATKKIDAKKIDAKTAAPKAPKAVEVPKAPVAK